MILLNFEWKIILILCFILHLFRQYSIDFFIYQPFIDRLLKIIISVSYIYV